MKTKPIVFTNSQPIFISAIRRILIITMIMSFSLSAQVKIQEKIELRDNNVSAESLNKVSEQVSSVIQTIRVEVSFKTHNVISPPGQVYANVAFYKSSTRKEYENYNTSGHVSLSHQVTSPQSGYEQRWIYIRMGITNGHTPWNLNRGSAGVEATVYINDEEVYSFSSNNYTNKNISVFVTPLECDEIIECSSSAPQVFDENMAKFYVLEQNQDWQWIDQHGKVHTSNSGQKYILDEDEDEKKYRPACEIFGINGITGLLVDTEHSSSGSNPYYLGYEMDITACLNKTEYSVPIWMFNVSNVKIPLISDVCTDELISKGWVNLGDGTDEILLGAAIQDCNDLHEAIEALNYWKTGSYFFLINEIENQYKYFSDSGILEHEKEHVNQIKEFTDRVMNYPPIGLPKIRDSLYLHQQDFPCPEDALNYGRRKVQDYFTKLLFTGSDLSQAHGKKKYNIFGKERKINNSELLADIEARDHYVIVIQRILDWALDQDWFDEEDDDCYNTFFKVY